MSRIAYAAAMSRPTTRPLGTATADVQRGESDARVRKAKQDKMVQRSMSAAAAVLMGTTGMSRDPAMGLPQGVPAPSSTNAVAVRIAHVLGTEHEPQKFHLAPLSETRDMCVPPQRSVEDDAPPVQTS